MRNLKSPRRDFAIVALAGPVSNLLLATLATGCCARRLDHQACADARRTASECVSCSCFGMAVVQVNVLLAVFNLIPVPPLDGGNVHDRASAPHARSRGLINAHSALRVSLLLYAS